MKAQLLLPMFATLCFTGAANSQPPEQPRREPERPPRESPEARRPNPDQPRPEARKSNPDQPRPEIRRANPEPPRPEVRKPNPDQPRPEIRRPNPEPPRPETRREEGRHPAPGALAPWLRRPEMGKGGPREGDRSRTPEMHRPSAGDRPDASHRSPGFGPPPPGSRGGPDPLQELRGQVQRLTHEVHELRAMLEVQRHHMQQSAEHRRSGFQPPVSRGAPGPESRASHAPMPPKRDFHRGDVGAQEKGRPHPPGDHPMPQGDGRRPPGDREPHGNPPPPR